MAVAMHSYSIHKSSEFTNDVSKEMAFNGYFSSVFTQSSTYDALLIASVIRSEDSSFTPQAVSNT